MKTTTRILISTFMCLALVFSVGAIAHAQTDASGSGTSGTTLSPGTTGGTGSTDATTGSTGGAGTTGTTNTSGTGGATGATGDTSTTGTTPGLPNTGVGDAPINLAVLTGSFLALCAGAILYTRRFAH
jgi:hypothetical protein